MRRGKGRASGGEPLVRGAVQLRGGRGRVGGRSDRRSFNLDFAGAVFLGEPWRSWLYAFGFAVCVGVVFAIFGGFGVGFVVAFGVVGWVYAFGVRRLFFRARLRDCRCCDLVAGQHGRRDADLWGRGGRGDCGCGRRLGAVTA